MASGLPPLSVLQIQDAAAASPGSKNWLRYDWLQYPPPGTAPLGEPLFPAGEEVQRPVGSVPPPLCNSCPTEAMDFSLQADGIPPISIPPMKGIQPGSLIPFVQATIWSWRSCLALGVTSLALPVSWVAGLCELRVLILILFFHWISWGKSLFSGPENVVILFRSASSLWLKGSSSAL